MRKFLLPLVLLTAIAVLAGACSNDDPTTAPRDNGDDADVERNDEGEVVITIDGDEVVLTSGLSGFDDCDNLLDHLRSEAADRVGPYGFNDGGWYGGPVPFLEDEVAQTQDDSVDVAEADFEAGDDGGDAGAAPTAGRFEEVSGDLDTGAVEGVDFSGTNVQEVGVDEADIIKTDGERIFVVANNELVVVDADRREVVGSVEVQAGWNPEMFLLGDELLLVTNGWFGEDIAVPLPATGGDAEAEFADDIAIEPYWYDTTWTIVTRISISDDRPEITERMLIDGEYVSSRGIDGVARIIIRSNPQWRFPFVYPQSSAGEERAADANREAVLESELSDWIPTYTLLDDDGGTVDSGLLPSCGQVHAPTEFSGFGVLSVLSVPIDGDLDTKETTAVLAPGNVVYASTESVFVATQTWLDWQVFDDDQDWEEAWNARHTSIHRFALSNDGAAYTASGSVAGDVRDQFSLSEHEGHLRVITTTGEAWDQTSETFVRVLREADGELTEVGAVGDMGNGEAVQSVRFQGPVGYVVTFRQVDPFYTLDLADPENPKVVGELKIPGFSSYLHPIGDGKVLGVGSAGTDDGIITGSKVSIFDVSDLSDPQEVAVWEAPGGWNDVGWDHRSFLWWGPEQLAVIPVTVWDQGQHWSGAVVLQVDGSEIREVGRIDHKDERDGSVGDTDCRQITADDVDLGSNPDEFESEFEYLLWDEYTLLLACGPNDDYEAKGFECYAEPWLREEAQRLEIDVVDDDEELVICWSHFEQQMPTINRTMVMNGDELWSLSSPWGYYSGEAPARLQVNDLIDLDRLGVVTID